MIPGKLEISPKKIFIPTIISCLLIVNLFVFVYIYNNQKNFQKTILLLQAEAFTSGLEQKGLQFMNDFNNLAYLYQNSFSDKNTLKISPIFLENVKTFYSRHQNLINNLQLIDSGLNVTNIYYHPTGQFLIDHYETKQNFKLLSYETLMFKNGESLYFVPIYFHNSLQANLVVILNLQNFFRHNLQPLHVENTIYQNIYTPLGGFEQLSIFNFIPSSKLKQSIHKAKTTNAPQWVINNLEINHKKEKYISICYPFRFLNNTFVYLYHFKIQYIQKQLFVHALLIVVFNLVILLIVIFYYLQMVKQKNREEEKLRESEEAFKEIMELIPIGIIITTKNNQILSINKTATRILQINNSQEVIGRNISHKFLTTKSLAFDNEIASVFETDHFIQYENNGNEIVLYKKDIPLRLRGEEIVVQSFIDVTPIEKSRKREIAANMAKSEFLAKMSHEIRTPINGIVGMADALLAMPLTKEQIEFVNIIKKSADTLLNILNDVLDVSKIEAGKMVLEEIPFEIRKEIALVVHLFKVTAEEKNIQLITKIDPNVPEKVIGDPFRIRQILNNLVNNAIKFTPEGKIEISVKKIEDYNRNLLLQFKISDTGIGIPKEKISNIFKSFAQADNSTTRKYGGTGLGTTIAKQLVELMNGEITVESPSGISNNPNLPGTCFTFTIELFSNEKLMKNIDVTQITSFQQIKTLLITNHMPDDNVISEAFALFNVPLEMHYFNKGTIDLLKKNITLQDNNSRYLLLVIRDATNFDGFKLMARLQELQLTNSFHILMISNNDKQGNFLRSLRMGADHYIIMPFETSEIFNFLCETYTSLNLKDEVGKFKIQQLPENINILVAEDNPINQKVALTLFKNIGYEVDFAKNGIEVLEMMKNKKYDIIFMDIMMPEMDGIQATLEIRKMDIHIPIIAMTANISKDEKQEALNAGMYDYVTKPVRIDTVKKILIKLFSRYKDDNE